MGVGETGDESEDEGEDDESAEAVETGVGRRERTVQWWMWRVGRWGFGDEGGEMEASVLMRVDGLICGLLPRLPSV